MIPNGCILFTIILQCFIRCVDIYNIEGISNKYIYVQILTISQNCPSLWNEKLSLLIYIQCT